MAPIDTPSRVAIEWLADFIRFYPATAVEVRDIALEYDFDNIMLRFLDLFSEKECFYSRPDFISRCYLLANIIREEQESQKEFLIGSQE